VICIIPVDDYIYGRHKSHHSHKLSAGAITGITVSVILSILVLSTSLIVLCVCVRHYRKKGRSPAYFLLQKQHPRILEATASDSEAYVPAQPTAVKYNKFTDECSIETTPTNSSDTGPSPDNITTTAATTTTTTTTVDNI